MSDLTPEAESRVRELIAEGWSDRRIAQMMAEDLEPRLRGAASATLRPAVTAIRSTIPRRAGRPPWTQETWHEAVIAARRKAPADPLTALIGKHGHPISKNRYNTLVRRFGLPEG